MASQCIFEFTKPWSPIASPNSLDHGLPVHLQTLPIMASRCISELTQSRSPIAYTNSLDHSLGVYLCVHSVLASKCISELARSRPPNTSHSLLNLGLQVHLQTRWITTSKYIVKKQWWVYGDTGVMEVEWATWSIYLGNPGVDRHYLLLISCCHTMKIHTLSFPTFGLTRSFRDFMDPCNCMDPHGRVVLKFLTISLRCSSQTSFFSWIPFGCCERCSRVLIVGSLPFSSIVSPQRPPSGVCLSSLTGHLQVLLRLCSTIICSQIDHTYIYRDLNNACHTMM